MIRFDPEARSGERRLRVWDRVQDSLLERDLEGTSCNSTVLDTTWGVAPAEGHAVALRMTRSRNDATLVPTRSEAEAAARQGEAEARQAEAAARQAEAEARQAEAEARQTAEARVRELEAELARRS